MSVATAITTAFSYVALSVREVLAGTHSGCRSDGDADRRGENLGWGCMCGEQSRHDTQRRSHSVK
jgi:hypothetical protein